MKRLFFFCALLFSAQSVMATEPLHDRLSYQGYEGNIFPSECCWLEKKDSRQLRELQGKIFREQSCSAIGGPVSDLKLEDDKLFLTSLRVCGGDIALSKIYPKTEQPIFADWLTDTYSTQFNYLCHNEDNRSVYEFEHTLVVEKGILMSKETIVNDRSTCTQ